MVVEEHPAREGGVERLSWGPAMLTSLLRRGLLLLTRGLLVVVCALVAITFVPFFSKAFGPLLVGLPVGLLLLHVALSWWLAAPSREHLAAGLPWVLWGWLPVPLVTLVFEPWVLSTVTNWSMPSSHEYVPNPLFRVTLCLYLFVTALVLATGRPTLPRALLRLTGPWVLFLGALVLRFSTSPRPIFQG